MGKVLKFRPKDQPKKANMSDPNQAVKEILKGFSKKEIKELKDQLEKGVS